MNMQYVMQMHMDEIISEGIVLTKYALIEMNASRHL